MRKRLASVVSCVISLALAGSAHAAVRPPFDAVTLTRPSPERLAAARRLAGDPALRQVGAAASVDERFGVPTFLWAARYPGRTGAAAMRSRATAPEAAREHLGRIAPLYGLDRPDLDGAVLRSIHDTGRGGVIASYRQRVNGIEVFRDEIRLMMDRDLELVAVSGFIPGRAEAGRGGIRPYRLGAAEAVGRALDDFAGRAVQRGALRAGAKAPGDYETFALAAVPGVAPLSQPIRSKRVYFHRPGGLEPAYYVEVLGELEAYAYVVSALDGGILYRHGLIVSDSYSYRVWADGTSLHQPFDGPQGAAPTPHPFGTPNSHAPPYILPSLVTLQNVPFSHNDPWLPPAATETQGNNVDAYADLFGPDGFNGGDLRADITSPGTFDRTYDTAQAPGASANQRKASATQLFYTCNFLHDWFYDTGFDEASGNAQALNYGRGGVEGDRMRAEAQDYAGTNNANMLTPADGASPRMQMYVFTPPEFSQVTVTSPPLGPLEVETASFGPQTFSLSGALALANDGVGVTSDACQAVGGSVSGKIALIDRGSCSFTTQAENAQAAGAIGAIIANNVPGAGPMSMGGFSGATIPVLSISKEDGDALKAELMGGPVSVTMTRQLEVYRDGTLDNQVVAHEWGHYISHRLVGNSNGLTTLQSAGMGEGWGDFLAMLLTVRPEDALVASNTDFSGVYSVGGYVVGATLAPTNSYYFGFRRVPYSTDFTKNGLTFQHIQDGVPLPTFPPTQFGADGAFNAEVHNTGEVWCTMLWECYVALLSDTGRLTFAQAQSRMKDYLVAGLKMTPNAPTFTEARDAILAAAQAGDMADFDAFWAAFARRGIGVGAISPDRYTNDNIGVVESYALGGDLAFVSATLDDDIASCDADGYLDDGESGHLVVTLRNVGATTLSATTASISSANPAVSFPNGATPAFASTLPLTTTVVSIPVVVQGASGVEELDFSIDYDDAGLLVAGPRNAVMETIGHADDQASATETVEALNPTWTFAGDPGFGGTPWSRLAISATDHRFYAPDPGGLADLYLVSPPLDVAASGNFTFSFQHAHSFEVSDGTFWDGGVIEISINNGATWSDIGASATPSYGGTLYVGADNPLSGRSAYVAQSAGYPALQAVAVNLGTAYAGQTVRVRFRLGADQAVGDVGWEIDNLVFTNLTNLPFVDVIGEPDPCVAIAVGAGRAEDWSFAIAGANPVSDRTHFRFALPTAARVEIGIFDVTGRRVATLAEGRFEAGTHSVAWNGPSGAGAARAGVYFARMSAGGHSFTRKVLMLR